MKEGNCSYFIDNKVYEITSGDIVLIPDGVILVEDGKIVDFGKSKDVKIPEGAELIDAGGLFIGPGLIDIHTHAGGEKDFHLEPEYAANANLKAGTTTVLPTLYFSMTKIVFYY